MEVLIMLAFFVVSTLVISYFINSRKRKDFPPGPWGFPILGHLPMLSQEPHKTFIKWKPKYGPILGLQFGSFPCVVISDYQLSKEAFADPVFSGRPHLEMTGVRSGGVIQGIAFTEGRIWREQRGFAQRRLKEIGGFGTKSKSMESVIITQAQELVQEISTHDGHPLSTHSLFNLYYWNALWAIIAGEPLKRDDPILKSFVTRFLEALYNTNVQTMLPMFIPWTGALLPQWLTGEAGLSVILKETSKVMQPFIDDHWRSHVAGQPRDFIEAYIDEIKSTNDPASSFHPVWSQHSMASTLADLFLGGIDTGAMVQEWICLLLALHPESQKRLADELETVMGVGKAGRPASLLDRDRMPYLEAVLHEAMRIRPVAPLPTFHSTMQPVEFHGYKIPKGTMVFINVYEAHHNKQRWGDPENFRPERWLNEDRTEFIRQEGFMAFSTGKRICPGEQVGRDELFIFTTTLVQAFSIHVDETQPRPSLDPKLGGTILGPRHHTLLFKAR